MATSDSPLNISAARTLQTVLSGTKINPLLVVDFDGLNDGQAVWGAGSVEGKRFSSVPGSTAYSNGFGVIATTNIAPPGKTSCCAMSIAKGSDGDPAGGRTGVNYGAFGGHISLPSGVFVEGSELWAGEWVYFPSNWLWASETAQSEIKYRRFKHAESPNSPKSLGMLDLYVLNGRYSYYGTSESPPAINSDQQSGWLFQNEFQHKSEKFTKYSGASIPLGRWVWLEQYLYCHSDPYLAKRRLWLDGVFVREQVGDQAKWRSNDGNLHTQEIPGGCQTLDTPTDWLTSYLVFTYWNRYAKQDQTCYVGSFHIHNDIKDLKAEDEFGNKMMGEQ